MWRRRFLIVCLEHYTSRLEKEESECVSDAKLRTALQDFTQDVKQKEVPLEELEEISLECEYRSREEWSEMPADIIVTNNAMLERLLLRPDANGIFETQDEEGHSTWRYIIIDEAHSYTGATGTEIGLTNWRGGFYAAFRQMTPSVRLNSRCDLSM